MFGLTKIFLTINSIFFGYYFFSKIFPKVNICKKTLKLLGYKFNNIDLENSPSKLIIIGSHTSIYDFFIGALYYYAILHAKYDSYILMKKNFEIFTTPILSLIDKKFKLISVPKKINNGLTKLIIDDLKDKNDFVLFIAPEGTRKLTERIKSGYWFIAKELDANIAFLGIDFNFKTITLEASRKPYETWDEEQTNFADSCKKYIPLYPERCYWNKDYYY